MKQVIEFPTRVTETSSSLIDLVLTNGPSNVCESNVLPVGLTDHGLVYIVRKLNRPKLQPRIVTFRSFRRFNLNNFTGDLLNLDLVLNPVPTDVNVAWNCWKRNFVRICDRHASVITTRARGVKTPWVTEECITLPHYHDRLNRKAEQTGLRDNWKHYRSCRNYVNNYRNTLKKKLLPDKNYGK